LRCIAKKALICGIDHASIYIHPHPVQPGLSNRSSERGQEVIVDNPRQVNQRRGYGIGKSSCPRIDWLGVIERQLWGCPGIALGRHKFATDDSRAEVG
jgi:hypothetical protein